MPRNLPLKLLPLLVLVACGTQQEQCISRNTSEYRAVSRLLADVEGNLARGYAWQEKNVVRTEWDDCRAVVRNKAGERVIVSRPCLRDVTDTVRYRVAIDPAAEKRKRDNLVERRAALAKQANSAVSACRAAYPEEKA